MIEKPRTLPARILGTIALGILLLTPCRALGGDPMRSSSEASPTSGRWMLDFRHDGSIELTMKRRADGHGNWSSANDYEVKDFQGLQRPAGASEVPARFTMVRDAGTISFEGRLNEAGGEGHFSFSGSPEYVAALAKMGYRVPDGDDLFSLAVHDVSRAFIQDLEKLGYKLVPLDDLMSMRIHGATPEFIRELKALGYDHLPVDDLVAMRIHGASSEFVRALKALGYERVASDDLVSMRIHGVTPEFVRELQELGYRGVSAEDLVSMRIHGVSIDYVKKVQGRFKNVSIDELVEMKIHGRS